MSNKTPSTLWARRAMPRVAFFVRILMHFCVLFVLALCPGTAPKAGLITVAESEAPADQDGSSEEVAISVQARTRFVSNQRSTPLPVPVPVRIGFSPARASLAGVPHAGHRLANNLLAPLRC